jgi:CRP-like cAMP-binding protein
MSQNDSKNKPVFSELTQMVTNAGRPIFEQGAASFQAYYIEEGRVEVTVRDGGHIIKLAELGPGEIFGEMGVLENEMRMATVIAMEPTIVSVIKREQLEERISNIEDKFIRSLIAAQTKRLREANKMQVQYYRRFVELQNSLMGLASGVDSGIDENKRNEFALEIVPLMEAMEKLVRKYQR